MHSSKGSKRTGRAAFDLPRVDLGGAASNDRWLRRMLRADAEATRLIDEHVRILTKHKGGRKRG